MNHVGSNRPSRIDLDYVTAIEACMDQIKRINADYTQAKAAERRRDWQQRDDDNRRL